MIPLSRSKLEPLSRACAPPRAAAPLARDGAEDLGGAWSTRWSSSEEWGPFVEATYLRDGGRPPRDENVEREVLRRYAPSRSSPGTA